MNNTTAAHIRYIVVTFDRYIVVTFGSRQLIIAFSSEEHEDSQAFRHLLCETNVKRDYTVKFSARRPRASANKYVTYSVLNYQGAMIDVPAL